MVLVHGSGSSIAQLKKIFMEVGGTYISNIFRHYIVTMQECLQGKRTGGRPKRSSKVIAREKCSGKSAAANFCSVHLHSLSCRLKM